MCLLQPPLSSFPRYHERVTLQKLQSQLHAVTVLKTPVKMFVACCLLLWRSGLRLLSTTEASVMTLSTRDSLKSPVSGDPCLFHALSTCTEAVK